MTYTKTRFRKAWGTPADKMAAVMQHMTAFDSMHLGQPNFYGMVLRLGREYTAAPRPKGMRKQQDKMCFRNALHLMLSDPDRYTYVEGIACSSIPMLHAWCVTADGTVVDPTWKWPEESAYYGIPFTREFVCRETVENKVYGLLDSPSTVAKLMKGGGSFNPALDKSQVRPYDEATAQHGPEPEIEKLESRT